MQKIKLVIERLVIIFMKKSLKSLLLTCALLASQMTYAADVESHISLKQPGNKAVTYTLTDHNGKLEASAPLPLTLTKTVSRNGEDEVITVTIRANEKVYFNFGGAISSRMRPASGSMSCILTAATPSQHPER